MGLVLMKPKGKRYGGQTSWLTNATHHHETYKMECKNPSYGLGTNVSTTTNSVREELKTLFPNDGYKNANNIAVSHSFGGLVTRNLDMRNQLDGNDKNFGGFITVHTPNVGALLAENYNNGKMQQIFTEMTTKVKKAFLKDPLVPIQEFLIIFTTVPGLVISKLGEFWDLIKLALLGNNDELFGGVQDYGKLLGFLDDAKIQDLTPGNPLLTDLNNYQTGVAKINIYGSESTNIFNRLMSSLLIKPGSKQLDIKSDESLDNVFKGIQGGYNANAKSHQILGVIGDITGTNLINKWFNHGKPLPFYSNAATWSEGAEYFRVGLEADWLRIIGAERFETKTVVKKVLTATCQNEIENLKNFLNKVTNERKIYEITLKIGNLQNNPACYNNITTTEYIPIHEATDGIVNVSSQKASGGILFENVYCNHFEALNTKVLSDNFVDIFKNGANGSVWFQTPLR